MSFSRVYSAQATSLETAVISVETDVSNGLRSFSLVGLPNRSVEEAKDRISSAIKNTGFKSPKQRNQKVVVSLAPASIKKEGTSLDLAIALGYLESINEISFKEVESIFIGELSLNGELRPIKGALPIAQKALKKGFKRIFLPRDNAAEASFIKDIEIYGANSLLEVITHINRKRDAEYNPPRSIALEPITPIERKKRVFKEDMSDIKGQESAKRALEICAAGRHNIAMYGPPGTGKTLLAKALISILPPLDEERVFESTSLHSVAGTLGKDRPLITDPPFRSPHHTSSPAAVIGGGTVPQPGEITLAHNGVLFLDEFPEFDRRIIEALREPMEEGAVSVSRSLGKVRFPADFILVAAFNPCPCGYLGSEKVDCICTANDVNRYRKKLSGPIMDRVDLWCSVEAVSPCKLSERKKDGEEKSEDIKIRVERATAKQKRRLSKDGILSNKDMSARDINRKARLTEGAEGLLITSSERMNLSARTFHKSIKIARTIADLDNSSDIKEGHILEALQYRPSLSIAL